MIYLLHKTVHHKKAVTLFERELGFCRERRGRFSRVSVYWKSSLKAIQKVPLLPINRDSEDSTSRNESLGLPAEALRAKAGAVIGI